MKKVKYYFYRGRVSCDGVVAHSFSGVIDSQDTPHEVFKEVSKVNKEDGDRLTVFIDELRRL